MENQSEIEKYIETLTDKEKLALNKAREILGDSFDIKKIWDFCSGIKAKVNINKKYSYKNIYFFKIFKNYFINKINGRICSRDYNQLR